MFVNSMFVQFANVKLFNYALNSDWLPKNSANSFAIIQKYKVSGKSWSTRLGDVIQWWCSINCPWLSCKSLIACWNSGNIYIRISWLEDQVERMGGAIPNRFVYYTFGSEPLWQSYTIGSWSRRSWRPAMLFKGFSPHHIGQKQKIIWLSFNRFHGTYVDSN